MENEIVRLREEKDLEVWGINYCSTSFMRNMLGRKRKYDMNILQICIVLTPEFEGYNGKSLPAYGSMGKVAMTMETAR